MSNFEVECRDCGWQGKKSDLIGMTDDDKNRVCCPECGSKDTHDLRKEFDKL